MFNISILVLKIIIISILVIWLRVEETKSIIVFILIILIKILLLGKIIWHSNNIILEKNNKQKIQQNSRGLYLKMNMECMGIKIWDKAKKVLTEYHLYKAIKSKITIH